MAKFKLAFGLHNHQPVGNFEAVFQEAHKKAYLPFLKLVSEHPSFRFSLHQSGILWRWQERAHPDYFQMVGDLVDRGRVELMTGGFYEPILVAIPERDALGQIAMLDRFLGDHFEANPTGLWLTERIWEPHLPRILGQAGVKYLPIDDTHFLYAGLELAQLTGPFLTESEGYAITLLPIQKRLRYLIPFGTVEEVIAELRRQAERRPEGLAVYADDGEKFGVWPKTHEHCYRDHWLENLFEALEQNADWLEVITLSEAAAIKPVGRAYLPSASYAEMLHWALPPIAFLEYEQLERWLKKEGRLDQYGRFIRGGHWRGFLAKYDEANLMHKKMLDVSRHLAEVEASGVAEPQIIDRARDRLYAGQCNCPYWHGVFGGLYLPHIRQAVYSSLVKADHLLSEVEAKSGIAVEELDYDYDGRPELVVRSDRFTSVIKPSTGGMLLELSLNRHDFSVTDTLTRRREGYHLKLDQALVEADLPPTTSTDKTASIHDLILAKEAGLKNYLVEDWYLKRCFIDHFFTGDVDLAKFRIARYGEEGDFIIEPYESRIGRPSGRIELTRHGHLWRPEAVIPITLVKTYAFAPDADIVTVEYRMQRGVDYDVEVRFGIETNFNFQAGHAEDRYVLIDEHRHDASFLDSTASYDLCRSFAMIDEYRGLAVAMNSNLPCEIWHHPIFSVSLSEGGFEKVYQGTTFVNLYHVRLGAEPFVVRLTLFAGTMDKRPQTTVRSAVVSS
jgi:alpha-amylase